MKTLILILSVFVITFNANAGYLKVGVGQSLAGKILTETILGENEFDTKNQFLEPAILAYGFNMGGRLHGEIEASYANFEEDAVGGVDGTIITGGFNLLWLWTANPVDFFAGFGVTYGNYKIDNALLEAQNSVGANIFFGLDVLLSNSLSLGLEYRHRQNMSPAELSPGFDVTFATASALLNFKYRFSTSDSVSSYSY